MLLAILLAILFAVLGCYFASFFETLSLHRSALIIAPSLGINLCWVVLSGSTNSVPRNMSIISTVRGIAKEARHDSLLRQYPSCHISLATYCHQDAATWIGEGSLAWDIQTTRARFVVSTCELLGKGRLVSYWNPRVLSVSLLATAFS